MKEYDKKVYYIEDIAKSYDDYQEDTIDLISNIVEIGFLTILTSATICLPILLKTNPNLLSADKVKIALIGLGVPAAAIPIMISKIKAAIKANKSRKANAKFIEENRGDVTDIELENFLEDDYNYEMIKSMKKITE